MCPCRPVHRIAACCIAGGGILASVTRHDGRLDADVENVQVEEAPDNYSPAADDPALVVQRSLPTSTHLYPPLPTSTHLYPPLSTSTHPYPPLPTPTHPCPPLPTSTHLYPPLPTPTHLYPPLPTSTHLYPPLPTFTYLSLPLTNVHRSVRVVYGVQQLTAGCFHTLMVHSHTHCQHPTHTQSLYPNPNHTQCQYISLSDYASHSRLDQ